MTKPDEFFWSRTARGAETDCWIWRGKKSVAGYGYMRHTSGKTITAHRFSWELHNGQRADGMQVCHRCDSPSCVNPHHLFLGTPLDNMRDMWTKGRQGDRSRKLTPEAVKAIRASKLSWRKTAAQFGICKETLRKIKKRITWAHVP